MKLTNYTLPKIETFISLDTTEYILKEAYGINIYNICIYLIEKYYCSDDIDVAIIMTKYNRSREKLYKIIRTNSENKTSIYHPSHFVLLTNVIKIPTVDEFKNQFFTHFGVFGEIEKRIITINTSDFNGKIIIDNKNSLFIDHITRLLKKIDPNINVDKNGNVITSKGNICGNQLIMNILARKYKINIVETKGKDGRINTDQKSRNNALNGIGSDAIVYFNINVTYKRGPYIYKRNDNTIYESFDIPEEIALGHELIHALHTVQGSLSPLTEEFHYYELCKDKNGELKNTHRSINLFGWGLQKMKQGL